jgi:hypothetical protein
MQSVHAPHIPPRMVTLVWIFSGLMKYLHKKFCPTATFCTMPILVLNLDLCINNPVSVTQPGTNLNILKCLYVIKYAVVCSLISWYRFMVMEEHAAFIFLAKDRSSRFF